MKYVILIFSLLILPTISLAQTSGVTVDLIWEADTYVPSFYQGHSQIAPESWVKVVALPVVSNATAINNVQVDNLQFDWTKDYREITSASGVGQNVLLYKADTSGGDTVKVTVSNPNGGVLAVKQITLPIAEPKLVFYREDPLIGTDYKSALNKDFTLNKPEITMRATPFFFSAAEVLKKNLTFNWTMGGSKIVTDPNDQQLATFVAPETGSGANKIEVTAESQNSVFQSAKNSLSITFNQNGSIF